MRKLLIIIISLLSITPNIFANYGTGVNIEMYLMRKGVKVNIALIFKGGENPTFLEIERKSTAPLSVYRKIITLNEEQIQTLIKDGKIILSDIYPESRQLDSYYRMKIKDKDGNIKTPPGIFLAKASHNEAITFGEHDLKDESMFIPEDEKNLPTYEEYGLNLKLERVKLTVLITIGGGKNVEGSWFIERKTDKPLASFRVVKTIKADDIALVKAGEHVFIDKYPESRKLDSYYRLVIVNKEGERLESPPVFLAGDESGSK